MSFEDHGGQDHANAFGAIRRRRALQLGATTVGALGLLATGAIAQPERGIARSTTAGGFWIGDPAGAQALGFDDSGWRLLDLPHDWSIEDLSYAPSI
jgi:beta-galactosidase